MVPRSVALCPIHGPDNGIASSEQTPRATRGQSSQGTTPTGPWGLLATALSGPKLDRERPMFHPFQGELRQERKGPPHVVALHHDLSPVGNVWTGSFGFGGLAATSTGPAVDSVLSIIGSAVGSPLVDSAGRPVFAPMPPLPSLEAANSEAAVGRRGPWQGHNLSGGPAKRGLVDRGRESYYTRLVPPANRVAGDGALCHYRRVF